MKKLIHVAKKPIKANVIIPGSKSITNRALLLASLAGGVSEIFNMLISDDTRAFVHALHQLGIVVQVDEKTQSCIVAGGNGQFPKREANVWCDEAGTAGRFLLAACATSPGTYQFSAGPQLTNRPIETLLKILVSQGAEIIPKDATQMPFSIVGVDGLQGGEINLDGSETGQFLSALLMIAPFAKSTLSIKTHHLVSRPYIDMTCLMMAEFGVLVRRMHHALFSVPIPQRYHAQNYIVEPDLSSASYFFAAAAVTGGEMIIQPVERKNSKQADVAFLSVLEKMGCVVTEKTTGLVVKGPKELRGINVDMRDFPDTFMTLAAIAPFANSPTTITNIGHARLKESDRIAAMREGLEKLQVKVEEGHDWLKIFPSTPKAAVIDSHRDHRIAMSFAVTGLRTEGIEIEGAECVSKTFPEFFEWWDGVVLPPFSKGVVV